ncbi:MAG TPA: alpha/beta hydrolase [Mycobacteriales bacterium]|nr:alpha/beta hydrolase [Mycobacteriales bacterium]
MAHRLSGADVFHPDLRPIARVLPTRAFSGPRTARLSRFGTAHMRDRRRDGVEVIDLGDGCSVRLYRPEGLATRAPALLWIHGGGFIIGNALQDQARCVALARSANVIVASVDYRLAPEHPFPAGLEDCYRALAWLAARPEVDEARIAVGGASAGGCLAASLALLALERQVRPAFQLLVYPMLDDRTALRPDRDPGVRRLWDAKSNRYAWSAYLGRPGGAADVSPVAAPARARELGALPPAWIGVGTVDLLYDEGVEYARRLREAGVACDVEVVDGAFHGFDVLRTTAVARAFEAAQVEALRKALAA